MAEKFPVFQMSSWMCLDENESKSKDKVSMRNKPVIVAS